VNNSFFDVYMTAGFGLLGYIFIKLGCEGAPLLLGFVLGPMMEENFRRSLLLSRGDFSVFFTRPISLGLLLAKRRSRKSSRRTARTDGKRAGRLPALFFTSFVASAGGTRAA
jgi:hypothetical protein